MAIVVGSPKTVQFAPTAIAIAPTTRSQRISTVRLRRTAVSCSPTVRSIERRFVFFGGVHNKVYACVCVCCDVCCAQLENVQLYVVAVCVCVCWTCVRFELVLVLSVRVFMCRDTSCGAFRPSSVVRRQSFGRSVGRVVRCSKLCARCITHFRIVHVWIAEYAE